MTPEEYYEIELIKKQLKLDTYTEEQIKEIRSVYDKASKNMLEYAKKKKLAKYGEGGWTKDRYLNILANFEKTDQALQSLIVDKTLKAGEFAYKTEMKAFEGVLSVDGLVPEFKKFIISPEKLKAYYEQVEIGGDVLKKWTSATFTSEIQKKISQEIMAGALVGDGYKAIEQRLKKAYSHIDKVFLESIVRTHIQSANNKALEDVAEQNSNVVKAVRWLATLDPKCCVACGGLDGREYLIKKHPTIPLHPRCRCCLIPITKTWKELGVDQEEFTKKIRPDNFEEGIASKTTQTYPERFKDFSKEEKLKIVGPGRYKYLEDGSLDFEDLVNPHTGSIHKLSELDKVVEKKAK